jgi:hypothetical protein
VRRRALRVELTRRRTLAAEAALALRASLTSLTGWRAWVVRKLFPTIAHRAQVLEAAVKEVGELEARCNRRLRRSA